MGISDAIFSFTVGYQVYNWITIVEQHPISVFDAAESVLFYILIIIIHSFVLVQSIIIGFFELPSNNTQGLIEKVNESIIALFMREHFFFYSLLFIV